MKKLFVLLRQGNLDEVKRIISDKPELLNCVAGPTPKKDHGQSLLQVALKSGNFEIAEYLIDAGIDVNFMEGEDDDPGLRAPVLFDAITAAIDSLCIGQYRTQEEATRKFMESDRALSLMKKIILKGADVNRKTSNGMNAINWSLHHAGLMGRPSAYPNSQEKVREQLTSVLDFLIENGADYNAWLDGGYYPEPSPGPSIRRLFWGELEFEAINNEEYEQMKLFLQNYFDSRSIEVKTNMA